MLKVLIARKVEMMVNTRKSKIQERSGKVFANVIAMKKESITSDVIRLLIRND